MINSPPSSVQKWEKYQNLTKLQKKFDLDSILKNMLNGELSPNLPF